MNREEGLDQYEMFVDGESTPASSGDSLAVEDPATAANGAAVAAGDRYDIDRAVSAARGAQQSWAR